MESFKKETITIYKEYEKISLLEYYLDNETSLESTVSNLIDYYIIISHEISILNKKFKIS
jgi:hypothetical protein